MNRTSFSGSNCESQQNGGTLKRSGGNFAGFSPGLRVRTTFHRSYRRSI